MNQPTIWPKELQLQQKLPPYILSLSLEIDECGEKIVKPSQREAVIIIILPRGILFVKSD